MYIMAPEPMPYQLLDIISADQARNEELPAAFDETNVLTLDDITGSPR